MRVAELQSDVKSRTWGSRVFTVLAIYFPVINHRIALSASGLFPSQGDDGVEQLSVTQVHCYGPGPGGQ